MPSLQAYNTIQSFHSDSAVCFALFLHHLPDMCNQLHPHALVTAMQARFCPAAACFCAGNACSALDAQVLLLA
jgi:hypothetical protein